MLTMSRGIALEMVLVSLACGCGTALADEEIDFQPAPDFLQLPDGWTLGKCSAVAVNRRACLR